MIEASDFKRGMCISYKGEAMTVVDVRFTTPTARGATPLAKVKLRSLTTAKLLSESIRCSEKFEEVDVEQRPCTYLYSDGERWHFMDAETYDQFDFGRDELGDSTGYLIDGIEGLRAMVIDGRIVNLTLPSSDPRSSIHPAAERSGPAVRCSAMAAASGQYFR